MDVLITGAGGFIGKHCVHALAEKHVLRALTRSAPLSGSLLQGGCQTVQGDVTIPETLTDAVNGVEAIVHTVGIIVEPAGVSFENTVLQGTKNLVDAACKAGVRRFVYISAMGTRTNAKSRYHQTKFAAEEYIRNSGMEYVILRPSIVFGPEDKFINKFLSMPVIPLPAGGNQKYQPIFVDDLAEIILCAVEKEDIKNLTLDAGGPEVLSFRKMMEIALTAKGIHKPMMSIPLGGIGIMSSLFSPLQKLSPSLSPITADQYLMMQEDNVGDNTPLLNALPEIQLTSLKEGFARYMRKS